MLNWQRWEDTATAWDQALLKAKDYNVFQSFAWGEYKKQANWFPVRYYSVNNKGEILGLVQVLIKKLVFGYTFIWAPGGVVLCFPNHKPDEIAKLIQNLMKELTNDYPKSLTRFHSHMEINSFMSYSLKKICSQPYRSINSGFTIKFKLDQVSALQLRQNMKKKHRYYTKKAAAMGIRWSSGNNSELLSDLVEIHREMVVIKQLSEVGANFDELKIMCDIFGDNVLILVGYLENTPVSACLVLLFGNKCIYSVASTNGKGRDVYAAYAMFEHLMHELRARNVSEFDFGGVDPVSPNAVGVNHFKNGFGGNIIQHLGEWETASSEFTRIIINFAISIKMKQL